MKVSVNHRYDCFPFSCNGVTFNNVSLTLLHFAIITKKVKSVKLLVNELGADINAKVHLSAPLSCLDLAKTPTLVDIDSVDSSSELSAEIVSFLERKSMPWFSYARAKSLILPLSVGIFSIVFYYKFVKS